MALRKILYDFSQKLNKSLHEVWTAQNNRRPREVFAEGRRDENQKAVTMDPTYPTLQHIIKVALL